MNTLITRLPSPATPAAACISAELWVALQFDVAIQLTSEALDAWRREEVMSAKALAWRAAGVAQSLQMTLDMARGGELARHLFELFDYLQRRLRGGAQTEPEQAYREVVDLLSQVRQAWQTEPDLVPVHARAVASAVH